MGQHELFEAQPVFGIEIVQGTPPTNAAPVIKTVEPTILFSNLFLFAKQLRKNRNAHELGIRRALPRSG
jgi:hypothetical protein